MSFTYENLVMPQLDARPFGARRLSVLTDEALFQQTGIRIAFTGRSGGVSSSPYDELNLGAHVGDALDDVMQNRTLLMAALCGETIPLLVPNQVHGNHVEVVRANDAKSLVASQQRIAQGSDALAVTCENVGALLCYADCTPVIIVSPQGPFAVVHAGWRGVVASIARLSLEKLASECGCTSSTDLKEFASGCNVYIGPHIRSECFEVGAEVADQFSNLFGAECVTEKRHVSMSHALAVDLLRVGVSQERICDVSICTQCHSDSYFSYRASGGTCGRHGAIAFRKG